MPYLNLGKERKIFYKVQGKGTPLVFLHGAHGSHNLWNRQLPFFSKFKIVTMDMRGHGTSFKPRTGYRLESMVEDVIVLINHLRIKDAVFVGSSMGGVVAQMIGAMHPSRVKALVLVGTLAKAAWMGEAKEVAKKGKLEGYQPGVRIWFTPKSDPGDIKIALREASKASPFFSTRVILENPNWDIRGEISKIKAPTLIIVGSEDFDTTPVRESEEIHGLIAHSEMDIVPEAGHLVMLEKSDEFNKIVADFLTRILAV
jgi:pimeloyl-ACP methyl ester carboxylesterase